MEPARLSASEVLASPTWLPVAVDLARHELTLVAMNHDAYDASVFLDERRRGAGASGTADVRELLAVPHGDITPANYLFHTAYCGSTLLAKAWQAISSSLVLREPPLAVSLLAAPRIRRCDAQASQLVHLIARLEARRFHPELPTLVKCRSTAVAWLPEYLRAGIGPAVFLYASLEDSIASYLRNNHRHAEAAAKAELLAKHPQMDDALGALHPWQLPPARRAALLWLMLAHAHHVLPATAPVRSLPARCWLHEPKPVLMALSTWWGEALTEARCEALLASGLFERHAKTGAPLVRAQPDASPSEEVADAVAWAENLCPQLVSQPWARPLLPMEGPCSPH